MFHDARIKLTVWYLLIIMTISLAFSVIIYRNTVTEVIRGIRIQQARVERVIGYGPTHPPEIDPALLDEVRDRVRLNLFLINLAILGISGTAGYFLAGRTLKPIRKMVEEQNRFITDASHELRTPLTAIRTEIEVNLRNKNLSLPEARGLLMSNLEEVNNLQALSDGLIKMTAYQKGQNKMLFTTVSLAKITKEAIRRVNGMAREKQISLLNQVKEIALTGDEAMLTELLVIFLDNAIKYSPKNSRVKIGAKQNDGSVLITISDQGMGISEEEIPHLFDRFYRSDKSRTKTDVAGYGLGLAIAKQIVERHRGLIKVESVVGKGTKFTIKLPRNSVYSQF